MIKQSHKRIKLVFGNENNFIKGVDKWNYHIYYGF
jgi:hypothetical protein